MLNNVNAEGKEVGNVWQTALWKGVMRMSGHRLEALTLAPVSF